MKVRNMISNKGNIVANQFIITNDDGGETFQSYESTIVIKTLESTYLDIDKWNYSVTTAKYRNQFLGETTKETQAKIDSKEYILLDLNRT